MSKRTKVLGIIGIVICNVAFWCLIIREWSGVSGPIPQPSQIKSMTATYGDIAEGKMIYVPPNQCKSILDSFQPCSRTKLGESCFCGRLAVTLNDNETIYFELFCDGADPATFGIERGEEKTYYSGGNPNAWEGLLRAAAAANNASGK